MKRFLFLSAVLVIFLFCGYWTFSRTRTQELNPLIVAGDTHKLVFENDFVVVMETKLPAGKVEPLHRHRHGVIVYLSDFKIRITEQGEEPRDVERKKGQVRWREPTVHSVVNIGNTEGHVINVELK